MYKDQKKFDRNNDGRLNSREWSDWYFHKYGFGIEEEELRQVERAVRNWEFWLNTNLSALEKTYADVHRECRALMIPWSKEKERMVDHIFASMILKGLRHGKAWDMVLQTNCAQIYVHNRSFRPYQELTKAFLSRHPSVSSFSQIASTVRSTNTLFPEDCCLTEDKCGRFWCALIDALPPYSPEAEEIPEPIISALYDCELSFTDDVFSTSTDEERDCIEKHWIARRGTAEDIEREKVLRDAKRLFAEVSDRVSQIPELSLSELNDLGKILESLENDVFCVEPIDEDSKAWEEWNAVYSPIEAAWRKMLGRKSALEVAREIAKQREAKECAIKKRQLSADPALLDKEYTCCSVFIHKARCEYLYLAPDEPVSVGDKVTVLMGDNDYKTTGEIRSITTYTGRNAPFPPWEMKKAVKIEEGEHNE